MNKISPGQLRKWEMERPPKMCGTFLVVEIVEEKYLIDVYNPGGETLWWIVQDGRRKMMWEHMILKESKVLNE